MYNFNTIREMIDFRMVTKPNKIVDWYKPSVYGVGCKGNMNTTYLSELGTYKNLPEYDVWNNMISRCYNPNDSKFKNYGAIMINPICHRWKCYEYFCKDIPYLKGYDLWRKYPHMYEIDKDTIQFNIETKYKIYSPETCCFISSRDNTLEKHYRAALNQTGFIGVFIHKSNNYFVRVGNDYFGTYDNPIAAASLYNKVARFRGYPEEYINKIDNEMEFNEIYRHAVDQHRKHGKIQLYRLLDSK